jgi:4-hydroxy-2-oxoheptanedioate aldolase
MHVNHVKKRLRAGEPSVGTWLSIPAPESAEYVSNLGLDWLVVDAEHNPVDIRTLTQMFVAMSNSGVAPMVRIPWNTPENFKRVLDAGAWGVVVPMVHSRAEAEQAVAASRYHPEGHRSVGGGRHGVSFGTSAAEYYRAANEQVLLVLQIEHIEGVEHVDEILSTPGVDACFIGPNDLAASMGLGLGTPLESDNPQVVEAIMRVRDACRKHNVAPGIHCTSAQAVNMRIDQGFQFCAMASELKYMLAGLGTDIEELNWKAAERKQPIEDVSAKAESGPMVRY